MLMSLMCSCLHEEFTCIITILSINGWTLKLLCIYVLSTSPPTYINDRLTTFIPKTHAISFNKLYINNGDEIY